MIDALPASLRGRAAKAAAGGAVALAMLILPHFEGSEPKPYLDPVGIPTVCVGHTGNVNMEHVYSKEECDTLLRGDLGIAFNAIDKYVHVPLGDATRAALASFIFNVGVDAFRKSTLLRRLNVGEGVEACPELKRWVYAGGRKLPGLVKRRSVEAALCAEGFHQLEAPTNDNTPLPLERPKRDAA